MNWYLLWKYKHWIAIAVLSFMYLGQVSYTNHLGGMLQEAEAKHQAYVDNQDKLLAQAQADALTQEKAMTQKLLDAEKNYKAQIKQITADARAADLAADSLSKQLSEAKRRVPTATTKTITEYIDTSADILKACIAEYRTVAEAADGHAADARRLNEGWPE